MLGFSGAGTSMSVGHSVRNEKLGRAIGVFEGVVMTCHSSRLVFEGIMWALTRHGLLLSQAVTMRRDRCITRIYYCTIIPLSLSRFVDR